MLDACGGQKRLLEPLELEFRDVCEPVCGCWELNLYFYGEDQLLLIELSL